ARSTAWPCCSPACGTSAIERVSPAGPRPPPPGDHSRIPRHISRRILRRRGHAAVDQHATSNGLRGFRNRDEHEGVFGVQAIFDAAWRQRALAGDAAAVTDFANAVLQPLFGFCLNRVGRNRHLCEEVVQETLVRALRDLPRYDPARARNNIFPWLTGLAGNEIHRVLTRERAAVSLETLWQRVDQELLAVYARLEAEPLGADVLVREETRELVNATMAQLPPHYR